LRDIFNYLEKCIVQLEAVSRKNSILGEDKEYIRILNAELEKNNKSKDEVFESIVNRVEEEANE
jgi:hypothetical protein